VGGNTSVGMGFAPRPSPRIEWTGDGEQEGAIVPVSLSGGARHGDKPRRGS